MVTGNFRKLNGEFYPTCQVAKKLSRRLLTRRARSSGLVDPVQLSTQAVKFDSFKGNGRVARACT